MEIKIILSGDEYDTLSSYEYPYQRDNFWRSILKNRNVEFDEFIGVKGQPNSLEFTVTFVKYGNYHECFDENIKGQKAANTFWVNPSQDNKYVGGMCIQFENGYTLISHGGCSSGSDYNCTYIVDPLGNSIAKFEHTD